MEIVNEGKAGADKWHTNVTAMNLFPFEYLLSLTSFVFRTLFLQCVKLIQTPNLKMPRVNYARVRKSPLPPQIMPKRS